MSSGTATGFSSVPSFAGSASVGAGLLPNYIRAEFVNVLFTRVELVGLPESPLAWTGLEREIHPQ